MKASALVRMGLVAALLAWSGLLLAQGQNGVADDTGTSTPKHHAPRRKPPKKKPRARKKPTVDAGAPDVAQPAIDASKVEEDDEEEDEDAGVTEAAAPVHAASAADARADADDDDDDEDEDEGDDDESDTAYELGIEMATESRLVWRGLPESRGAVLQSSGWAGLYGLSLEGWASYLLNNEGPFGATSVAGADLTASYAFSVGDLRLRPSLVLLYFPEGLSSSTTAEASLGISYPLGDFRIVSGTNIDIALQPGAYFGTLGLTWGRAKPPWTVKGIADFGWATGKYNYEYLGKNVAAFDVVHAGASVRYDLGAAFYFELHVDMSALVAPTLSGSLQEPTIIVGGAGFGVDWSTPR